MLTDPLVVKALSLSANSTISPGSTDSYARVDAGDGSARYISPQFFGNNIPVTLRISHSVSQENKPVKTDRTLIRFDALGVSPTGQELTAYAYAVIGSPRGVLINLVDNEPLTALLMAELLVGCMCGITASALSEDRLVRILAGES